ncbi:MAG TPA: hypothetical protein VLA21_09200 [Candidatus Limnocylindria bacterium]|nr:hypothetical protein [Candidatus Limnocylindria bacterium]
MGLFLRRVLSLVAALVVMAGFYAFTVLVEGGDNRRGGDFLVREDPSPVTPISEVASSDARVLARAFGASMPVPGSPSQGSVASGSYHGYVTRTLQMQGAAGSVRGVRPAAAAPSIMPQDAVFLASDKALLGFPAMAAMEGGREIYALLTNDAAFLIVPSVPGNLAGFAPGDP